jgi:excisionase family DNA binding protein
MSQSQSVVPALEFDTPLAAAHLGVKPHTLEVWRSSGRYAVPFVRVGRLIKYRRSDLDAWLASRTVNAEQKAA